MNLSSLWIGLLAGVFGGLVGLGGGIVAVPLMSAFLKLSQHKAVATSLVMVVFTGLVGALTYATHGTVDWLAALLIFPSAMLTANWGPALPIACRNGSSSGFLAGTWWW